MIIQCEQCQTKFRLDDSKVKDSGIKVRCARCKHVFAVSNDQQESTQQTGFGTIFDQNVAHMDEAHPIDPYSPHSGFALAEPRPEFDLESSAFEVEEPEEPATTIDPHLFDLPEEEPFPIATLGPEFSDYDPEEDKIAVPVADESPAKGSEITFDGFDFGNVPEYTEFNAQNQEPFSDLDGTSADSTAPLNFDIQFSEFSDSAAVPEADAGSQSSAPASDEPFHLGEIDFGDDLSSLSSQLVNPDDSKGALDFGFGHLDEPQEASSPFAGSLGTSWTPPVYVAPQETAPEPRTSTELTSEKIGMWGPWSLAVPKPPGSEVQEKTGLSSFAIPEQYKQSHLTTLLFAVIAFFGMLMIIYNGNKQTQEELTIPGQAVQTAQVAPSGQAAGKIVLSGVDAAFVNNKKSGELLVITGSAVNSFDTPRAALQIKGLVYGENDQVVAGKTAYCGNTLTKEQLAILPLETIEAAMANQFGSALDNMEVGPGKTIACMVVISKLPENAKNYGAVAAGSLPAKPKQKKNELPAKSAE